MRQTSATCRPRLTYQAEIWLSLRCKACLVEGDCMAQQDACQVLPTHPVLRSEKVLGSHPLRLGQHGHQGWEHLLHDANAWTWG